VTRWLDQLKPRHVWDLGANTGHFSRIAARLGARTLALDADPACVDTLVQALEREPAGDILPLVYDLANPTPAIGWATEERMTLRERGPADVLLALALIHHLAIGNNVPLPRIAEHFAQLGRHLIIEFVPKSDPMIQRMLASRPDVFDDYDSKRFERAFDARYELRERVAVAGSARTLYLMVAR
jgi:ribosomal protein L11 methylase PrmA